ncbi:methionine adenosyltransferase regulatory beta subunit-related [Dunaliella salina]|uniref:Methionine adenosyltransferase regulatory beta subunit-related n=1 Tax=Dunaliella salina TaxID=3046 RepID=A0ABQ7GUB9_DUNSA|nr:methionine adenosyltransferase regulatory beta subunit-related [Dunaliella salina]|eukprot:KAF5838191.1 methionine adenosyltransferase regulatory beta subunit-related [Dunaliella salina]
MNDSFGRAAGLSGHCKHLATMKVAYTFSSRTLTKAPANAVACKVDLVSDEGLLGAFQEHGPFQAVINCAAISQPGECEKKPEHARSVNVPSAVLDCLKSQQCEHGVSACLIHLSTDQVYDGSKEWWSEDDACHPVNVYGQTKLLGEQTIMDRWAHSIILRSSIIYGPEPSEPVGRALFLSWLDKALSDVQSPCPTFFEDEWRCPTYVQDIISLCSMLLELESRSPQDLAARAGVYNMGGPDRLSRLDMANEVAKLRGYDTSRIKGVPSASVSRPVRSPQDISMKSERLENAFGIKFKPFHIALREIFT